MKRKPPESPVRSDINVTPLVDVCLVLLIIFMVVTPLIGTGGRVVLPATSTPERIAEGKNQLTLTVDAQGQLFVDEDWVPQERLGRLLADLHAQDPDRPVRLRADRSLSYDRVRRVMQSLNEAGFTKAGLVTVRRSPASA
jgi:biopolymer transport protein ExbD